MTALDILNVRPGSYTYEHGFMEFVDAPQYAYIVNNVYTDRLAQTVYALLLEYQSGVTDSYDADMCILSVNDKEFYLDGYEVASIVKELKEMGVTPATIHDPCGNFGSGLLIGE